MRLATLREYSYLIEEIESMQREIIDASYPVSSPNGRESIGAPGNTPSNPTEKAANRMIELREMLMTSMKRSLDLRIEIEHWMTTVDNSEIRMIVRTHYIEGPKRTSQSHHHWEWADTCEVLYGYRDKRYARRKLTDYLKKENGEEEDADDI